LGAVDRGVFFTSVWRRWSVGVDGGPQHKRVSKKKGEKKKLKKKKKARRKPKGR